MARLGRTSVPRRCALLLAGALVLASCAPRGWQLPESSLRVEPPAPAIAAVAPEPPLRSLPPPRIGAEGAPASPGPALMCGGTPYEPSLRHGKVVLSGTLESARLAPAWLYSAGPASALLLRFAEDSVRRGPEWIRGGSELPGDVRTVRVVGQRGP